MPIMVCQVVTLTSCAKVARVPVSLPLVPALVGEMPDKYLLPADQPPDQPPVSKRGRYGPHHRHYFSRPTRRRAAAPSEPA
jgi:hypothetical protein